MVVIAFQAEILSRIARSRIDGGTTYITDEPGAAIAIGEPEAAIATGELEAAKANGEPGAAKANGKLEAAIATGELEAVIANGEPGAAKAVWTAHGRAYSHGEKEAGNVQANSDCSGRVGGWRSRNRARASRKRTFIWGGGEDAQGSDQ